MQAEERILGVTALVVESQVNGHLAVNLQVWVLFLHLSYDICHELGGTVLRSTEVGVRDGGNLRFIVEETDRPCRQACDVLERLLVRVLVDEGVGDVVCATL